MEQSEHYIYLLELRDKIINLKTQSEEVNTIVETFNKKLPTIKNKVSQCIENFNNILPTLKNEVTQCMLTYITEYELENYINNAHMLQISQDEINVVCDHFLMAHLKTYGYVMPHMVNIIINTKNKTILDYYEKLRISAISAKYDIVIKSLKKNCKFAKESADRPFFIDNEIQKLTDLDIETWDSRLFTTSETQTKFLIVECCGNYNSEPVNSLRDSIFLHSFDAIRKYIIHMARKEKNIRSLFLMIYATESFVHKSPFTCSILCELVQIAQNHLLRQYIEDIDDCCDLAEGYYKYISSGGYGVSMSMDNIMSAILKNVINITIKKVTRTVESAHPKKSIKNHIDIKTLITQSVRTKLARIINSDCIKKRDPKNIKLIDL